MIRIYIIIESQKSNNLDTNGDNASLRAIRDALSMSSADKKSISRIHKQAHKIVKLDITSIDEIYTRNVTKKVKHII